MLPPTQICLPRQLNVSSIRPSRAVVVLFPLVPVTPTTIAGQRSAKRQISVVIGMFASAAICR